jgi:hypothetical protein
MKKPHSYLEKSRFRCKCGKLIKLNVADRKLDAEMLVCYSCWKKQEAARGNRMK